MDRGVGFSAVLCFLFLKKGDDINCVPQNQRRILSSRIPSEASSRRIEGSSDPGFPHTLRYIFPLALLGGKTLRMLDHGMSTDTLYFKI